METISREKYTSLIPGTSGSLDTSSSGYYLYFNADTLSRIVDEQSDMNKDIKKKYNKFETTVLIPNILSDLFMTEDLVPKNL
jgi:hypothetical protein